MIACGRKREPLPVIGFSSSRIDSPHEVWSTSQLPSTGYWPEKFGDWDAVMPRFAADLAAYAAR